MERAVGILISSIPGCLVGRSKSGPSGIALNAPREIVRSVARGTEDELPVHLQEQIPPLDSGNDAHRAYIRGFFMGMDTMGALLETLSDFTKLSWSGMKP